MSDNAEVFRQNKLAYEATINTLKALKDAGAIVGRTDRQVLLRSDRIPSILFEELLGMTIRLYEANDAADCSFISVFAEFKYNERVAMTRIEMVTQAYPPAPAAELATNDLYPFVEEVRGKLLAIPMLGDEHLEELEQLSAPPADLEERRSA